jgi:hypothetical protein
MVKRLFLHIWISLSLLFAGAQFTHAAEIHHGLGKFGDIHIHDGAEKDHGVGHVDEPAVDIREGTDSAAGFHCGAPLLSVCIEHAYLTRTMLRLRLAYLTGELATLRFNLDPPPPRA